MQPLRTMDYSCIFCGEEHAFYIDALGAAMCPEHLYEAVAPMFTAAGLELEYSSYDLSFKVPATLHHLGSDFKLPPVQFSFGTILGFADDFTLEVTSYDHPHASDTGKMCLGENEEIIGRAFANFDFPTLIATAINCANTYTPGDVYSSLEMCEACGEASSEFICGNCGAHICRECYENSPFLCLNCAVTCAYCGGLIDEGESLECEICGDTICGYCAREVEIEEDGPEGISIVTKTVCPYCYRRVGY